MQITDIQILPTIYKHKKYEWQWELIIPSGSYQKPSSPYGATYILSGVQRRNSTLITCLLIPKSCILAQEFGPALKKMNRALIKRGRQRQCPEVRKIFLRNQAYLYFGYPVCFYFRWNSVDSSVSSWKKRWTLVLQMSAKVWRQRGNGAVKVSFESRTAQMSALFHIFTCAFCLL